jgi:hypothetical protein
MLRHIYKSHHYKDMPTMAQLKQDAKDMGHSVKQSIQYVLRK